jgi:hypothetical protein
MMEQPVYHQGGHHLRAAQHRARVEGKIARRAQRPNIAQFQRFTQIQAKRTNLDVLMRDIESGADKNHVDTLTVRGT